MVNVGGVRIVFFFSEFLGAISVAHVTFCGVLLDCISGELTAFMRVSLPTDISLTVIMMSWDCSLSETVPLESTHWTLLLKDPFAA